MTDPGMADATYVGPMTPELVEQILDKVNAWLAVLINSFLSVPHTVQSTAPPETRLYKAGLCIYRHISNVASSPASVLLPLCSRSDAGLVAMLVICLCIILKFLHIYVSASAR